MTRPVRRRCPLRRVRAVRFSGVTRTVARTRRDAGGQAERRPTVESPLALAPYRPRDKSGPKNLLDWSDRHVSRATDDDAVLKRYLLLVVVLFAGAAVLVVGSALAAQIAGVPLWALLGLGVGGTGFGVYLRSRQRGGLCVPSSPPHGGGGHGPANEQGSSCRRRLNPRRRRRR